MSEHSEGLAHAEAIKTDAESSAFTEQLRNAAKRLLATEAEVLSMEVEQRDWFMSKPGHVDAFLLARTLPNLLDYLALIDWLQENEYGLVSHREKSPEGYEIWWDVVDRNGRTLTHPYGNPRDAMTAAREKGER